jgi:hypothetical protein
LSEDSSFLLYAIQDEVRVRHKKWTGGHMLELAVLGVLVVAGWMLGKRLASQQDPKSLGHGDIPMNMTSLGSKKRTHD